MKVRLSVLWGRGFWSCLSSCKLWHALKPAWLLDLSNLHRHRGGARNLALDTESLRDTSHEQHRS